MLSWTAGLGRSARGCKANGSRASGPCCSIRRAGVHCRVLWLLVCGRGGGAGLSAAANRTMSRIQTIADDAEAKVALTTHDVLERVQEVIDETPDFKRIRWRATDQLDARHGTRLAASRRPRRHAGLPPIHFRLDRHAQGRRAESCEPDAQFGFDLLCVRSDAVGRSVFWLPAITTWA